MSVGLVLQDSREILVEDELEAPLKETGIPQSFKPLEHLDRMDSKKTLSLSGRVTPLEVEENKPISAWEEDPLLEIEDSESPVLSDPDAIQQIDEIMAKKLFKNLSGYELDLLIRLFSEKPENAEKLTEWLELILAGDSQKARKEVQQFLNKNIEFKNTLSIAFHHNIKKWKEKSAAGKVKSLMKHTGKLIFSPLILTYSLLKGGAKLATSKTYRKTAYVGMKHFFKTRSLNYKTRREIASFLIKFGVAGVVSLAITGEIGSLGLATPLIAAAVGGVGIAAKIANDAARNKSATLVFAEILGDSVKASADAALVSGLYMGIAELATIISNGLSSKPETGDLESPLESDQAQEALTDLDLVTSTVDLAKTSKKLMSKTSIL